MKCSGSVDTSKQNVAKNPLVLVFDSVCPGAEPRVTKRRFLSLHRQYSTEIQAIVDDGQDPTWTTTFWKSLSKHLYVRGFYQTSRCLPVCEAIAASGRDAFCGTRQGQALHSLAQSTRTTHPRVAPPCCTLHLRNERLLRLY